MKTSLFILTFIVLFIGLVIAQPDSSPDSIGNRHKAPERVVKIDNVQEVASDSESSQFQDSVANKESTLVIDQSQNHFNPLDYGTKISIGLYLPYYNYDEKIQLSDPRSNEYGVTPGLSLKITKIMSNTGIMLRAQVSTLLGIRNTYEGSLQGQAITNKSGDIIGVNNKPYHTKKTNHFINGEFNLGYSNHSVWVPFALYSGFRLNLWHRDLGSDSNISNYENYKWFNIPVGCMLYKSIGAKRVLGIEGVIDFMFLGEMQAVTEEPSGKVEVEYPKVNLGKKAGYRIELMVGKKLNERVFVQLMPFVSAYGFGKSNVVMATIPSTSSMFDRQNSSFSFYKPESSTFLVGVNTSINIFKQKLK